MSIFSFSKKKVNIKKKKKMQSDIFIDTYIKYQIYQILITEEKKLVIKCNKKNN